MSWAAQVAGAFRDALEFDGKAVVLSDGTTALALFEAPAKTLFGEMQLSADYTLEYLPADLPGLVHGTTGTVEGRSFRVREVQPADDELTLKATLEML